MKRKICDFRGAISISRPCNALEVLPYENACLGHRGSYRAPNCCERWHELRGFVDDNSHRFNIYTLGVISVRARVRVGVGACA